MRQGLSLTGLTGVNGRGNAQENKLDIITKTPNPPHLKHNPLSQQQFFTFKTISPHKT